MTYALTLASGLGLLGATACVSTAEQLRKQFARERACPEAQVGVRELGGSVYEAEGCGKRAQYACGSFANGGSTAPCAERGLRGQAPPGGDPRRFPEERLQPPPGAPVTGH